MNTIDGYVTKVLSQKPEHKVYAERDTWQVEVEYTDEGIGFSPAITKLMFFTENEAYAVQPGYVFQH